MTRVLLLFSQSKIGGAEISLTRMALASSSIKYELASMKSEGPWCNWVRSRGKSPIMFGKEGVFKGGWMLGSLIRLIYYLRTEPIDFIYICGIRVCLWVRLIRFLIPNTKIIHGVRSNPNSDSSLDIFFRFVERTTSFLIDGWITNSKIAKQTLIKRCKIDKDMIFVIYNGIDDFPKKVPKYNNRPVEILTVANLQPRKGHKEYLQVISKVVKKIPNAKFIFIGRDDINGDIQKAINNAKLDDYVECTGYKQDISPWLKRARIFVLPSLWGEGCPTSILEAFSYKVPVIAYSIDGISELIDDGIDGYIVSFGSNDFEYRIIELLMSTTLAKKMGIRGSKKVIEEFNVLNCVKNHELVLKQIITK